VNRYPIIMVIIICSLAILSYPAKKYIIPEILWLIDTEREIRFYRKSMKSSLTNKKICHLSYFIRDYYGKHDRLPDDLNSFLKIKYKGGLKDGWGKELLIGVKSAKVGKLVSIISAGKDGLYTTDDDIIAIIPVNPETAIPQKNKEVQRIPEIKVNAKDMKEETRRRMAKLSRLIREYSGKLNRTYLEAWLTIKWDYPHILSDAWGNMFSISIEEAKVGQVVSVRSAGEDGFFGTEDDMVKKIPIDEKTSSLPEEFYELYMENQ